MVGIGQHDGIIGDWLPPPAIPAPVPFFSSILVDAMESPYPPLQPPPDQGKNEEQFAASAEATETDEKQPTSVSGDDRHSGDELLEARVCCDQKWSSRLGERVAARAGFNAPRLNTERMRSSDPSRMSGFRLPYLTIPSGLSPTSLLESPVFVANTMVQPSPTTGKFQLSVNIDSKSSTSGSVALEIKRDGLVEDGNASFTLETVEESCHSVYSGAMNKHSFCATEGLVQANGAFDEIDTCKAHDPISNSFHIQAKFSGSSSEKDMVAGAHMSDQRPFDLVHPSVDSCQVVEQNQRGGVDSTNGDSDGCISNYGCAASEDGYNWRKYGQKQVKDSEYPLSYYKCTHPNCPVRKVECSQEGHITEIIYKGAHNHPKPSPNRRSAIGFLNQVNEMSADISENGAAQFRCLDIDPAWSNAHKEGTDAAPEGRNDNPEVTSSVSGGSDHCPQSTSLHVQNAADQFEAGDAVDVSSTLSNDDKHDGGTWGNVSLGYDEGDESESKRRKIEGYGVEQGRASRAIREPRIVVQTTSEVDILYDGYRWRKYGQKVVKGNPNPRSYYKCTHPGCRVRKHVERASHDLKSVITTYEGKHNHDVPAARNSSHVGYCASYVSAQAASVQTHVHRPEEAPQVNDNMNLAKCEGLSPFDSFGISAEPHLVSSSRCFSFGMNQPSLTNLVMNGFSPSQQRLPVFPSSYLGQQRQMMNQGGYSLLRSEPKVEPGVAGVLHMSSGPSVYNQIMGGLPLGNQM